MQTRYHFPRCIDTCPISRGNSTLANSACFDQGTSGNTFTVNAAVRLELTSHFNEASRSPEGIAVMARSCRLLIGLCLTATLWLCEADAQPADEFSHAQDCGGRGRVVA